MVSGGFGITRPAITTDSRIHSSPAICTLIRNPMRLCSPPPLHIRLAAPISECPRVAGISLHPARGTHLSHRLVAQRTKYLQRRGGCGSIFLHGGNFLCDPCL